MSTRASLRRRAGVTQGRERPRLHLRRPREVEDGRRKITKCYLGPDKYTYATKQHSDVGIELKDMVYEIDSGPGSRLIDYINGLANKLSAEAEDGTLDLERARG